MKILRLCFQSKNSWQIFIFVFCAFSLLVVSAKSQSRKRLELDDLSIKGELLNDGRLNIVGRQRLSLQNYVKFRTNYRKVMVEELPTPAPKKMSVK